MTLIKYRLSSNLILRVQKIKFLISIRKSLIQLIIYIESSTRRMKVAILQRNCEGYCSSIASMQEIKTSGLCLFIQLLCVLATYCFKFSILHTHILVNMSIDFHTLEPYRNW